MYSQSRRLLSRTNWHPPRLSSISRRPLQRPEDASQGESRGEAASPELATSQVEIRYSAPPRKDLQSGDRIITMKNNLKALRSWRNDQRNSECSVALVPTMGALHDGHLSLARIAARENDVVVVSIYVNPTQFGVNEDLASYPRTSIADLTKLRELNKSLGEGGPFRGRIGMVFSPTTALMYPTLPPTSEIDGDGSFVLINPVGKVLEGASRPVFFRGVATVCMKLFNLVQPDTVYFGQKDVQQTVIIRRMIRDFHVNTTLRIIGTSRAGDGLAMSSRNVFLGTRRRAFAPLLYNILKLIRAEWREGARRRSDLVRPALKLLASETKAHAELPSRKRVRFELDYLSVADMNTMEEYADEAEIENCIVSIAVKLLPVEDVAPGEYTGEGDGGSRTIRLIDNTILPHDHPNPYDYARRSHDHTS